MKKTLLAGVAAASLALSGLSATPAFADSGTQARNLIIGLGALAIIGAAINDSRSHAAPAPARPAPTRPDRFSRALPAQCLDRVDTRHGVVRLFDPSCLRANYAGARHLPDNCMEVVRGRYGRERGYDPQCLAAAGYSVEAQRWGRRDGGNGWGGGWGGQWGQDRRH
ncbi:MAG: hypothetical protein GC146_07410 [Limimaricola sp.]|uniref:hypothetical protein n=1 Tax=Limimaricola sp. TaxID=2211665 RepID=UPI001DFDACEC|nr:hypothetical protein [Limimaricola sp.]MBI1417032.1 hypothetical protein [Limimaricola sp.]